MFIFGEFGVFYFLVTPAEIRLFALIPTVYGIKNDVFTIKIVLFLLSLQIYITS